VISVLVYHAGFAQLPGGLAGVDIFFVISGFVVSRSILADGDGRARTLFAGFYARRLRRIVPALVVMLVTTTLAYCLFVPNAWLSNAVERTDLSAFAGLSNVVLSLNGDEYFSPIATLNPFTHSWSLGVEEQFYLVLPAILILSRATGRGRNRAASVLVGILAALSLLACIILSRSAPRIAFYSIASRFWELGLGVLLCLTESRWKMAASRMSAFAGNLVALVGSAAIIVALCSPPGARFPFPMAILCDLGAAAIIAIAVARPQTWPARVLGAGPISATGRASYSIYLWHWPLIVLMRWTVGMEDAAHRLAACAAALILGFASYRLVERPTQHSAMLRKGGSGRQILLQLLLLAAAALASAGLLLAKNRISLSRTSDISTWYTGRGDRHLGPSPRHPVSFASTQVEEGVVRTWSPDPSVPRTVFMIGDSHSLPYLPAFRRLAEDTGVNARAYFIPNCSFMPLSTPMSELQGCHLAFYRHALSEIAANGRKGDVLFLPNLRVPRYVDQWGPVQSWSVTPQERARATAEAISLLRPVAARGVTILFESPTPIFRSVPFRCADWFNRMNPVCAAGLDIDRAEMDALRAAPLDQMRAIAGQIPGVRIWNAFDVLCPGRRCPAFRGDRPLFLDGDHLSAYGQSVLYPSLERAIAEASVAGYDQPSRR